MVSNDKYRDILKKTKKHNQKCFKNMYASLQCKIEKAYYIHKYHLIDSSAKTIQDIERTISFYA